MKAELATHYGDERVETVRREAVRASIAGQITSEEAVRRVQEALDTETQGVAD